MQTDSISTVCLVIHTVAKRLINDPANPTRFSENHKLARSSVITNSIKTLENGPHFLKKLLKLLLKKKKEKSLDETDSVTSLIAAVIQV